MRILVGTLYAGENEYDQCLCALAQQSYQDFEHVIISGLPNHLAHDRLYQTFMARSKEFDLFLKLDADMVLEDDSLLTQIVDQFVRIPHLVLLFVPVHDFFTDSYEVGAMHVYRSNMRWQQREAHPFADAHSVPRKHSLRVEGLRGTVSHCKNPSPFQSFHYGIQRGVKVRAAMRLTQPRLNRLRYLWWNVEAVWRNFNRTGNRRVGLAALGAEMALRGDFTVAHLDYTDTYAREIFSSRFSEMNEAELRELVLKLRRRNRWRTPSLMGMRIILAASVLLKGVVRSAMPSSLRNRLESRLAGKDGFLRP